MAEESQRYDLTGIRQLLLTAFTAEELQDLFYFSKTPELREVPNQFAPGDSYPTMVRKAVRYCDSRYLVGELLAEVKEANPRAYEKFGGTLRARPAAAHPGARPRWLVPALAAGAAVIVILVVVVLVLVLRGSEPAGPEPTEVAQATRKSTSTLTEPHTATDTPAASGTPEPSTLSPTSTTTPLPVPTVTAEPRADKVFIVTYYGTDGVKLRTGPDKSYAVNQTLEVGTQLEVEGDPEIVGDMRWWPVRADELGGWVTEWDSIRLIKPYFQVGDTVVVANPMSTGNVILWDDDCQHSLVLSRGTALSVIGGPSLAKCEAPESIPVLTVRQWWQVETETGEQGWIADFAAWNEDNWVQAVLIAPEWYVELTQQ